MTNQSFPVEYLSTDIISPNLFCDKKTRLSSKTLTIYVHNNIYNYIRKSLVQYSHRQDYLNNILRTYFFILYAARFSSYKISIKSLCNILNKQYTCVQSYLEFLTDYQHRYLEVDKQFSTRFSFEHSSTIYLQHTNTYTNFISFDNIDTSIPDNLDHTSRYFTKITYTFTDKFKQDYTTFKRLTDLVHKYSIKFNCKSNSNINIHTSSSLLWSILCEHNSLTDSRFDCQFSDSKSNIFVTCDGILSSENFLEVFMYNYKFIEHPAIQIACPAHFTEHSNRIYHEFQSLPSIERNKCMFQNECLTELYDVNASIFQILLIPVQAALQKKTLSQDEFNRFYTAVRTDIYKDCMLYLKEKYQQDYYDLSNMQARKDVKTFMQQYINSCPNTKDKFDTSITKMIDDYFMTKFPNIRNIIAYMHTYVPKGKRRLRKNMHEFFTQLETNVISNILCRDLYNYGITSFTVHDGIYVKYSDKLRLNSMNYSIESKLFEIIDFYILMK